MVHDADVLDVDVKYQVFIQAPRRWAHLGAPRTARVRVVLLPVHDVLHRAVQTRQRPLPIRAKG